MRRRIYFWRIGIANDWHDLLCRIGFGHDCVYDDPDDPEYIGFTAGICYRRGIHRGRTWARPGTELWQEAQPPADHPNGSAT